ncbi:MAG: hypothetical protein Unbinned579contig1003_35 [Prokaryotic dsDNA virus sp.]|nr:MAG: hypothetical protein Unbinned579contig1003_35 [Prokaryotic dsDNA virus sp.]|tara:strand:+ start:4440 stop:5351 length:912 start_codon:yes stop_codon:yes gene_type:complete
MAFTVTQPNFNGKASGYYISAALNDAKSLDYMTVLENVKYKMNIQTMAGSGLVADNICNYTSAGNLALQEKTITPKSLMVNLDICKETLLTSYEALQMKAGRTAGAPVSFEDYVISYVGEIIADSTETSIWQGTGAAGNFNGFLGAATGWLLPGVDGTVVQDAASGAYTAGNIIANLQSLSAAIPSAVYGKEDLHIYMNMKTYRFYISAVSTLGYVNAYNMNGDYEPVFEGVKIAPVYGLPDNQMVAALKGDLFFGTDLLSDSGSSITLLDMADKDGSDNIRLIARYTAGTQTGIGANIVRQS